MRKKNLGLSDLQTIGAIATILSTLLAFYIFFQDSQTPTQPPVVAEDNNASPSDSNVNKTSVNEQNIGSVNNQENDIEEIKKITSKFMSSYMKYKLTATSE